MIYEYKCQACEQVQEVWAKLSDPPPAACGTCGKGPLEKLISATAFALKGSGWYTTDYKRSASSTPAKKDDTKSETKAEGCGAPVCGTSACGSN